MWHVAGPHLGYHIELKFAGLAHDISSVRPLQWQPSRPRAETTQRIVESFDSAELEKLCDERPVELDTLPPFGVPHHNLQLPTPNNSN